MGPGSDDEQKQLWDWNFTNHTPTPEAIRKIEGLRAAAKAMKDAIIDMVPFGRDRSLALTSLEHMLFMANAGIARTENTDIQPDIPEEDKALKAEKPKKPETPQNDKPKDEKKES